MRAPWAILLALAALTCLAAGAAAQSVGQQFGAVDRCRTNCEPEQLNGPEPRVGDQPAGVILYAHFEEALSLAAINTQRPDPRYEPDRVIDLGPCLAIRVVPSLDANLGRCIVKGFYSPGLVDYPAGKFRTHMTPGLSYDATIRSETVLLYITLTSSLPAPDVTVHGRLEAGRHVGQGTVIAESDPATPPPRRHLVSGPGDAFHSWEFEVPLKVRSPTIPGTGSSPGFVLSFEVAQVREPQASAAQTGIGLRIGALFPPRLALVVDTPMRTEATEARMLDDTLFLRWSFSSVWGSYDVTDASLRIDSTGPMRLPEERVRHLLLKRSVDIDGHIRAVNSTWAVDVAGGRLPDGAYEATMSALNRQGTYRVEGAVGFEVRDGVPNVPGAPFRGHAVPTASAALALLFLAPAVAVRTWTSRAGTEREKLSSGRA